MIRLAALVVRNAPGILRHGKTREARPALWESA